MPFQKTLFATSNVRGQELDICYGKFYFASNKPGIRLGGGRNINLFHDGPRSLGIARLKAKADAGTLRGLLRLELRYALLRRR